MKNSKILVLGASGFIGRNLFEYLKANGHNVAGQQYSKNIHDLVSCDLTDFNSTKELINGNDYVFMMAAKTFGLGVLSKTPEALVRDNVVMNANVLQACYECGVKKVMMVSSSVVYQEDEKCLKEEDLDLNKQPYHLYLGVGWVKRYTEQLARFYDTLGLKVITVRPTNIYGKYDKHSEKAHFIPATIKKFLTQKEEIVVWGTGTNKKDFVYIDDFVEDVVKLFEKYDSCEPINICSGELRSIKEIVYILSILLGFKGKIVYDTSKPETISLKSISNGKIKAIVGRHLYTNINHGLYQTMRWIRDDLTRNSELKETMLFDYERVYSRTPKYRRSDPA